jgi:hypothetical protein
LFYFLWGGVSLPRGLYWFSARVAGVNTAWHLVLSCLVYQMSLKQIWSCHLAAMGTLLFSQWNVEWRSFLQVSGSGCWSFDSPWCFISAKCSSSITARFLIHGAHTVCFCALVTIFIFPSPTF